MVWTRFGHPNIWKVLSALKKGRQKVENIPISRRGKVLVTLLSSHGNSERHRPSPQLEQSLRATPHYHLNLGDGPWALQPGMWPRVLAGRQSQPCLHSADLTGSPSPSANVLLCLQGVTLQGGFSLEGELNHPHLDWTKAKNVKRQPKVCKWGPRELSHQETSFWVTYHSDGCGYTRCDL